MAIKVSSVAEEYAYLSAHPHQCSDGATGAWQKLSQARTWEWHDLLTVRCTKCGHEEVFDFDKSGAISPEMLDFIKNLGKQ